VRSLLHGAALGDTDAARGAAIMAEGIDNPVVQGLVTAAVGA
jgi:hypothetical protein